MTKKLSLTRPDNNYINKFSHNSVKQSLFFKLQNEFRFQNLPEL